MLDIIYGLVKPFLGELLVGLGALLAIAMAFFKGKNDGKKQEQDRQMRANYENERLRNNIEDRVRNAADDYTQRLRNKWYRD